MKLASFSLPRHEELVYFPCLMFAPSPLKKNFNLEETTTEQCVARHILFQLNIHRSVKNNRTEQKVKLFLPVQVYGNSGS